MTKEQMSKIYTILENKTGYSRSHITNVIYGRRNNDYIINEFNKLIQKKKTTKNKKTNKKK